MSATYVQGLLHSLQPSMLLMLICLEMLWINILNDSTILFTKFLYIRWTRWPY